MILDLDLGNTRAKWRLINEAGSVAEKNVSNVDDWLSGSFPRSWYAGIQRIRVASVLAEAAEKKLAEKLHSTFSLLPEIAASTSVCSGITNAYKDPWRLGVDRWLALIAAYKMCNQAVMVVDVGTALKVDVVDDTAHHIGGYIIPGAALMEHSLGQGTDRVRYESGMALDNLALGQDTRSCVQHGVASALVGAVLVALSQCDNDMGKRPRLYVTGGLGARLKERLEAAGVRGASLEPDLVLDGLAWALP